MQYASIGMHLLFISESWMCERLINLSMLIFTLNDIKLSLPKYDHMTLLFMQYASFCFFILES